MDWKRLGKGIWILFKFTLRFALAFAAFAIEVGCGTTGKQVPNHSWVNARERYEKGEISMDEFHEAMGYD